MRAVISRSLLLLATAASALVIAPRADALPTTSMFALAQMLSPIATKYAALGGADGFLGSPTIAEQTAPDGIGKYRHYEHGSIYWSPSTGAMEVHGLIRGRWAELGWEQSYLGYPMTDEIDTYDGEGRVTKFQGGELIWRKATNAVSEVKSTDLVVDLPTKVNEPWKVIQANGLPGSHNGKWVYCYDLVWNNDQPKTKGRELVSSATARVVWADDSHSGSAVSNVIVQKLGTGRYASTLHVIPGSYQERFGGDLGFVPQALPWANRPVVASGTGLAETGDVGAANGAYHIHYCITTAPDVGAFKPFESVPFAFRDYERSSDGVNWTSVAIGVPRTGDWVRRKGAGATAKVTPGLDVLNFGSVNGKVSMPAGYTPKVGGEFHVAVMAPWGEPLATKTITVTRGATTGPWSFSFAKIPNYAGLRLTATYEGASTPSATLIGGQSAEFAVKANKASAASISMTASNVN